MSDSNPASEVVDAIDAYLSYLSLSDDRRRALRARVLDAGPVDRGAAIERLQSELEKAPSEPELEDDDRELLGRLPSAPEVPFAMYTGYVPVDAAGNRNLFYWFSESQRDPASDPVPDDAPGGADECAFSHSGGCSDSPVSRQ